MDNFMLKLNGLGAQLNPLAKNIERSFGQVKRYAEEKLGTAEDITELPRPFLDMELKVNQLRDFLVTMVKVIVQHSTTTPTNLQEITRTLQGVTGSTLISPSLQEKETELTILGKAALSTSKGFQEEPFGALLDKFGQAYEQLGDGKLILDQEIYEKFLNPTKKLLNGLFEDISRAKKNVTTLRLSLDSLKSTQKSSNPQRAEAMQMEVEKAEDAFIEAVEECQSLMKKVIESNFVMTLVHQMVLLQLAFHKQSVQTLSNLVPELDEMLLTHEALYTSQKSS